MKLNEYETKHAHTVRTLSAECTVLLKKDGHFPLASPGKIALYGAGARRTIKGGSGSGEVNSRYFVTVEEGLKNAGFEITTSSWMDAYDIVEAAAHEDFIREIKARAKKKHVMAIFEGMGAVMPQPECDLPLDGAGDTAIYVLSRISGEGSDRRPVKGDILLTDSEIRDILAADKKYKNFMLVLNTGGVVDLSPVKNVSNILLLSQLGAETGNTLADILLGKSFPSGKLAATWAAWEQYPAIGDFGDANDTLYREGVFVGYRYFDSVKEEPLFPFGYGLGYADFETTVEAADKSCVTVAVRNAGAYPGKETVELYVAPPQGRLAKPVKTLAAFAKTQELAPGESQTLVIPFNLADAASYDAGAAAFVLEAGDYTVFAGEQPAVTLRLDETAVLKKVKNALGDPGFADWQPEQIPAVPAADTVIPIRAADFKTQTVSYELHPEIPDEISSLSDEELAQMNIGAFNPKGGAASVIGNASVTVAGAAGETAHVRNLPVLVMADGPAGLRISRDYTKDENGAHAVGEALPESMVELLGKAQRFIMKLLSRPKKQTGEVYHQYCTAIPIGTAVAQSRNLALARALGDLVGDEMERFGVNLWLAPAQNIQRDIRCGRNFEYYSEDPLISGKFAAAITDGVQRHPGCGATIKHFTANNQEYNRNLNNSRVSERAMREIYLRGFEICVRESHPAALMTSYNLLNGIHTAERRDLCTDILRCEWGYQGVVMTDWVVAGMVQDKSSTNRSCLADQTAAAGGALFMPGCKGDYDSIIKALKAGTLSRHQLEQNAADVLRTADRLGLR